MRRSEIWRARWRDVRFGERRITVPTTKTKQPRVVPLASALESILKTSAGEKDGYIVPRRRKWTWEARCILEELRRMCGNIPRDRIRWNAWRHTFATLLVQDGVSLDKISAWMGNSPEICRRHYAQFVPRGRHDEDIERL
ncbi:MAG: tyrosine-type recombinase/integrase [Candidatus Brocadiia bacterium]